MNFLSDIECIIAVLLGSWLAIARKMGRSGNVDAIRKCWSLGRFLWTDEKIDGLGGWKGRRRRMIILVWLTNEC